MNRKAVILTLLVSSVASASIYAKDSLVSEIVHAINSRPQSAPSSPQIDIGFSPNAGAEELVVKAISTARRSILLGAYSFTSKPVIQGLVAAKRRGVEVRCVLDKSNTESRKGIAAANLLVNADIPTRIDSEHKIHHNKYLVIDDLHVETGSFNYSASAAHENAENVLVVWNNPDLARKYADNWAVHWSHSQEFRSTY